MIQIQIRIIHTHHTKLLPTTHISCASLGVQTTQRDSAIIHISHRRTEAQAEAEVQEITLTVQIDRHLELGTVDQQSISYSQPILHD